MADGLLAEPAAAARGDLAPAPPRWCAEPAIRWLAVEGRRISKTRDLLQILCDHLVDQGLAIAWVRVAIRTLHPQVFSYGYEWRHGQAEVREVGLEHGIATSPQYLNSPLRAVFEQGLVIRRSLEPPADLTEFGILADLRESGLSDYIVFPVEFGAGRNNSVSWATDRPGGFSEDEIALLSDIVPILSTILETQSTRRTAGALLDTYLGRDPGGRVLEGTITRGEGEALRAIVMACDLRDFTPYSDTRESGEVIEALNDFFDAAGGPITARGGEILKFIGDGFLAIFRIDDDCATASAQAALAAVDEARANVHALNRRRAATGLSELRFGTALHAGEVVYGNIGTADRLDFTVIGPAVNLAFRLEALTKELGRAPLLSADFARLCEVPTEPLGAHALRGLSEPVEVFAPSGG
ncbi:MAG: adenylate/guanylate cyclase domain-containing protein [Rhodospirillaceae bacterium]|jgi:adenylate cyclase|nr:adenylate/guanylate cyclase domain-containing protein [Rhodospirillaceae bacterium]MBT6117909.1 adenylate/guanylate cyclase domain-containing protein [Rhodospirillaceae bacterium]